ncbi:alpha/beta fold hydrolase [Myxococcota bacterium]|nr:alpha/beta fold hydrolase [Myxococcota bacterium]
MSNSPVVLSAEAAALYPWTGGRLDVDGGRMHYLDEGPQRAPAILAVHGNPTWSFYWRALIPAFSQTSRVVIPDHIGCGLSDKPQGWSYRLADHIGNVQRLIQALDLQDITLIVHDWGGPIGLGAALRELPRIKRVVITNTGAFPSPHIPPSIAACRVPLLGDVMVRGFNGFVWAATWRTTERPLSAAVKAGLTAPYASWDDRVAIHRFVQDIPMSPDHPSYKTLQEVEAGLSRLEGLPTRLLWGDRDWCFSPIFRQEFERRMPWARSTAWDDVGHYVMEDAPERVVSAVRELLEGA